MKLSSSVHPSLLAAFPALYLYTRNLFEVSPRVLIAPIGLSVAAALAALAALGFVLGDDHRAGLITSAALVLFFSYSRHEAAMARTRWGAAAPSVARRSAVLLTQGLVLAIAWVLVVVLPAGWPERLTAAFNVGALGLVLLLGAGLIPRLSDAEADRANPPQPPRISLPAGRGRRPDIYYIVLDGFARWDVLRRVYGLDGEGFLDELERRGFRVARHSAANYCQTVLSLSSSLNATYLDDFTSPTSRDRLPLVGMIRRNAVAEALRGQGYRFISFATGYTPTEIAGADTYLRGAWSPGEFSSFLLGTTPLPFLFSRLLGGGAYRVHRDRILYTTGQLPRVAAIPGPKFVFSHILCPHPPFVFGERGEDVSPTDTPFSLCDGDDYRIHYGDADSYVRGYRGQVAFISGRILQAIDGVLASSAEPPVIVLQADHGPGSRLHFERPADSDLVERMGILNAYYLPGAADLRLPDGMTPVNTFPLIFNTYFDAGIPLNADTSFFSSYLHPFNFVELTGIEQEEERTAPAGDP
jgi:hypothetical protein